MWTYVAPLREMRFVIERVLQAPAQWRTWPATADLDVDTARAVLDEAAKFAQGVLAPINGAADLEGCSWRDGEVRTPSGYRDAYAAFVDGGWGALACHPDDGGQGLPALLDAAFNEMIAAANHGWTMYPGLLHGAYECLRAHGSDALKARYLARLARGEWLATMNLTEADAGSDLGRLRTRARPLDGDDDADGRFAITGQKIFISGGEHDLTENIVHLVLARLPGAPEGTRGVSLFLVPKFMPDGTRNAVHCDGLEKKMGIKGSATCQMRFEGAVGWRVGAPHRGLQAMFVMMNAARLHVGLQGLGHLEAAQQNARRYALERVQGRDRPIAEHPAVRRIVARQQALAEGLRVVAYRCAQLLDASHHAPAPAERAQAERFVGLLTPLVKAFLTEAGHRGADEALQVWGGHGYVHDHGIEQVVRDSRIAMIYEGTNEIQAIDFAQRKVLADDGATLGVWLDTLDADADLPATDPAFAAALRAHTQRLRGAVATLREAAAHDAQAPLAVADDLLRAFGHVMLAWAWLALDRAAAQALAEAATAPESPAWLDARRTIARLGLTQLLPEAEPAWHRLAAPQTVRWPPVTAPDGA